MTAPDHADALDWLAQQPKGTATAVVYDPPYAVGTPVRGREDGAAGSVYGPMSFLSRTMALCAQALRPGGICMIFTDWRRLPDMGYIASTVGLRPATCVAWVRNRPGTGGLMRASWDPVLIVARGVPDAIDRAAIPNVVVADYPTPRVHPYGKPPEVYRHVLARICRPGDIVLDPFAGSASSAQAAHELGLCWRGCDIDPQWAIPVELQGSLTETHEGPDCRAAAVAADAAAYNQHMEDVDRASRAYAKEPGYTAVLAADVLCPVCGTMHAKIGSGKGQVPAFVCPGPPVSTATCENRQEQER